MITQRQIAGVLDHPVYDTNGIRLGETRHLFLDDASGEPEWVSVETGLVGAGESLVPARGATLVCGHLEVPYTRATVDDAPYVDVDAGGFLVVDEEHRLYEHYGIARSGGRGWQQVLTKKLSDHPPEPRCDPGADPCRDTP
ncbi:PRC-barrel domain-containing protein [Streptomyces aureus]